MIKVYFFDPDQDNIYLGWRWVANDHIVEENETFVPVPESEYHNLYKFDNDQQTWIYAEPARFELQLVKIS